MIKALAFFYALIFPSLTYALELPTHKEFPPYPQVWGYDISDFPAIKDGLGDIDAYRMPDGDIWFLIDYSFKYKDPMEEGFGGYTDEKFILLKFFKGEQVELNEQQRSDFFKITERKELSKLNTKVHFSDGTTLSFYDDPPPKLCFLPQFLRSYYVKTDVHNKQMRYSILGVSPHADIWQDNAHCEVQGAPLFYQRIYLLNILIDLGDDTFIAYANGSNLILRFDKDLVTQFIPTHPVTAMQGNLVSRNFFVIDYSVIEKLEKSVLKRDVPFNQTMHDELLLYFKEKYQ